MILSSTGKKIVVILIAVVAILSLGFFLGRSTIPQKTVTEIKYLPGERITDTLRIPIPVKEIIPPDTINIIKECVRLGLFTELFPKRERDTIIVTKKDTSTALTDWATQRFYSSILFENDTIGKFSYDATVQYNRLQSFDYTFSPITRTVTVREQYIKKFSPFIGAGIVDGPSFVINGGAYINEKWGLSLLYMRDAKQRANNFGGMVLYKF